jgi:hypothetical protein
MARRKLTEAEKAGKSRLNYEAYTKIMDGLRPSATIIRFPVERTRKPARRSGYNHDGFNLPGPGPGSPRLIPARMGIEADVTHTVKVTFE